MMHVVYLYLVALVLGVAGGILQHLIEGFRKRGNKPVWASLPLGIGLILISPALLAMYMAKSVKEIIE